MTDGIISDKILNSKIGKYNKEYFTVHEFRGRSYIYWAVQLPLRFFHVYLLIFQFILNLGINQQENLVRLQWLAS